MPRPKGSKNKKTAASVETLESIEEKILSVETRIEELSAELKTAKNEMKELLRTKELILKTAAEKKAEEDKAAILAAFEASGRTVSEILEFLK